MKLLSTIILATVLCFSFNLSATELIQIKVNDPVPFHMHPNGSHFSVDVTLAADQSDLLVYFYWCDFAGEPLTEPKPLMINQNISVQSPSKLSGYYGLVFKPKNDEVMINDRWPGEELEFGFGITSLDQKPIRNEGESDRFGTVHTEMDDPYMPAWIKTMTWRTAAPQEWMLVNRDRNALGFYELPIIVGDEWESDDASPISMEQLNNLKSKVTQYFEADHRVKYWELGIEENLQNNYRQTFYWQNLAAKAAIIRSVADEVNSEIKLIYQIAELDLAPVRLFLNSEAAKSFDILSLHPYNWPDFPAAETWVAEYLGSVRNEMKQADHHLPIWFTEVGAPHHGNHPNHFFGYPEEDVNVQGLSLLRSASFMIKLHVVAFHENVEKVFWYNYIDREADREYAENHFGMVDFHGYPKPVYLAYTHLYSLLKGKQPAGLRTIDEDVLVYTYKDEDEKEQIQVIWSRSEGKREVTVKEIGYKLEGAKITNAVGKPEQTSGAYLEVSDVPLFIKSKL